MSQSHIGKILPADRYVPIVTWDVTASLYHALSHLYQPLIGVQAISLYQTLLSESVIRKHYMQEQTHHTLMTFLSLPLDDIFKARLKLEGIGLLRTYKQDSEQQVSYCYELQQPFSISQFFEDDMLSELLFHQLGEKKYRQLVETLHLEKQNVKSKGENVTANFDAVFVTHDRYTAKAAQPTPSMPIVKKQEGPMISESVIDFAWLEQSLTDRMIPAMRVLTVANKKLISQMGVLYDLTEQELESALVWAVNEDNLVDVKEFKTACLDLFQLKHKQIDIKLMDKKQVITTKSSNKSLSKEEQFVQMLEQISPKQLLEDLSGGHEASAQDLKLIGDIMSQQGLAPGVVNVLVHYVLLKTDMKLTKSYLEKIASHWARKNVKTVRQAMALAKAENNKYQQWGNKKSYYKKSNRKEIVPDWFEERMNESQTHKQPESRTKSENDEQPDDIAAIAKKYANRKPSNQ